MVRGPDTPEKSTDERRDGQEGEGRIQEKMLAMAVGSGILDAPSGTETRKPVLIEEEDDLEARGVT